MTSYSSIPSLGTARVATDVSHFLGEGPTWDPIRERVLWVDIMAGVVHSGRLMDGRIEIDERLDIGETAGAVAVAADGGWVVAGTHRLVYRTPDGELVRGRALVDGEDRRFNDGKPDPAGRFVVGTKGPGDELLIRVDADEAVTVLDHDLTLSNGLAWTADGRRMYSIDTGTRQIFVRDYDAAAGTTGERMLFAQLEHGHPDGMTIDAEGHLWVAVWGGGCVLRLAPSGEIVARVDVPAPHTSCPAFAGPGLDTLVITTAREHLTPEQLEEHPHSGRLFTFRPGVTGLAPHLWSGVRP
ncbi:SMP-30/gluconolactonase/LRE family protein [Microbacterium sp. NPDC019599]|uniref:SMP-30/gluconolactonase/LRE family protein n=1 Tax=Microbacterium sp. NPDC019599 TaxID=3154690 RepID=UPI0033C4B058